MFESKLVKLFKNNLLKNQFIVPIFIRLSKLILEKDFLQLSISVV